MSANKNTNNPLAMVFRDIVLVLGGVFAVRGTDDETIRRVARGLEKIYRRTFTADNPIKDMEDKPMLTPHPELAQLLRLINGGNEAAASSEGQGIFFEHSEEYVRMPGLFLRWEIEQVLEPGTDFHIEGAGKACDGETLYAVYRREQMKKEDNA